MLKQITASYLKALSASMSRKMQAVIALRMKEYIKYIQYIKYIKY